MRVSGNTLSGVVIRYGDISPGHKERFVSGAFSPVPDVPMRLQHDKNMEVLPAGKFALNDFPHQLEIRADLPAGSAALELVRRGALSGFSCEFHSLLESRSMGVRVIRRAKLVGIALVDIPSYPSSVAEVRALGDRGGRLGSYRGYIPAGKSMQCSCIGPNCTKALFDTGSFDELLGDDYKKEVLAIAGDYNSAIGSKSRGAIRFWEGKDGAIHFAVDVPNTARGRALLEQNQAVPLRARPVIQADASTFKIENGVARYTKARTRAINIKATDADDGWPAVKFKPAQEMEYPLPSGIAGLPDVQSTTLDPTKFYYLDKLMEIDEDDLGFDEDEVPKPVRRRSALWL